MTDKELIEYLIIKYLKYFRKYKCLPNYAEYHNLHIEKGRMIIPKRPFILLK